MPEEPPTHYANIVTVSVDPDVVYIELRRFIRSHLEMYRVSKQDEQSAVLSEETVYQHPPVAHVVLTYTAAKNLLANLMEMLPKMEAARKGS